MNEQLELGGLGARRGVGPHVAGGPPYVAPPARVEFDRKGELVVPVKRSMAAERERWMPYLIGGWPDYSHWIDPRSVPLCRHGHEPPSLAVMQALMRRCLVPQLFVRRCLSAAWREYPAGTEVLSYGSIDNAKFDLFILLG